ncbi:hypothetical protein [Mogibacterium timidum]|uniref:hypothetical protein n=1 Tax=Mogibacterium timidum TaxID=35519 RepID=UPI0028DD36B3|nr:hypothetical protein [Mogibacterium timidum]
MLKISWWLMMVMLLVGLAALYEYIESRYKNANLLFLIFDIGMLIALALPIIWLLL